MERGIKEEEGQAEEKEEGNKVVAARAEVRAATEGEEKVVGLDRVETQNRYQSKTRLAHGNHPDNIFEHI